MEADALDQPSMLLAFRAENVRSFRERVELDLLATALTEGGVAREIPWRAEGKPIHVLPAAGIFGANASGKTNLLKVIHDMRNHVLYSFRSGDPSGGFHRDHFLLDPDCRDLPSRYEIDLVLHGVRHEYGFVADDARVIEEWAYRYPRGKAALLFHRHDDDVRLGAISKAKGRAAREILRPNSLYLSASASANNPDLLPLYHWFESNLLIAEASSRSNRWAYTVQMLDDERTREQILALLHAADLGITGARIRKLDPQIVERVRHAVRILQGKEGEKEGSDAEVDFTELGLVLSHRGRAGDIDLEVHHESLGTLVWFGLVGPVRDALSHGRVLLVDEIESSLHPTLVRQLVRTFQSPASNPRGAQLVFSSHEATLLEGTHGNRVLGRDQVWFTEKRSDGGTRLYPLTDLAPRKEEAIGRRYLNGRYGAAPIVSREEFTDAAAMITAVEPK